jgi:3-methyladenine DNA glycosylase AlkD
MTLAQALKRLKTAGTAQNRKVYARHGVRPEMYGVSYANLGKLRQEIGTDHELARGLWESGEPGDERLEKRAVAAAKRVGKVEVDHGETGCKTPDALEYIARTKAHRAARKKKQQKPS